MTADRKGHYLAGATKPRLPASMFTITITPLLRGIESAHHTTIHRFGRAYLTYSRRREGRWAAPEVASFDSAPKAIAWMEAKADRQRTNWVVAPIASDAMTLLSWWTYAESQGIEWEQAEQTSPLNWSVQRGATPVTFQRFVARGTPDIIRYAHRGRTWQWVSGYQYLPDGAAVMGAPDDVAPEHVRVERRRCLISQEWNSAEAMCWHRAMVRFMAWWANHARAPWACTIGQLAIGMLRTHAPKRTLCTHSDASTHALERAACHGGRATAWYFGSVGRGINGPETHTESEGERTLRQVAGPVTHLDVSSMYPSILRDRVFPVKLKSVRSDLTPQALVEIAHHFGVIAKVEIDTPFAEFPYRDGDRVTYPVGKFTTTLAGPEILRCAETGTISRVIVASIYSLATPFAQCADVLIKARTTAPTALPTSNAIPAKLLANSLGGKLAQRTGKWKRSPEHDEAGRWGVLTEVHAQTGQRVKYRYLAGMSWRWEEDATGSGPYTSAFAYLTAYGRCLMSGIRALCPARSVVSQDTDGIWVLPAGLLAIRAAGLLEQVGAGHLRVVGTATNARWYGPRHYCADGEWTLAGFSASIVDSDNRTVWDTVKSSLWARHTHGAPTETVTTTRRSALRPETGGMAIAPDGWAIPRAALVVAAARAA